MITVSGVDSRSVLISWTGPRGGPILNDSRVSISPTISSGNNYTGSVQFTYLMEGDEGTYTCNVMILETSGSQSLDLSLLPSVLKLISVTVICAYVYILILASVPALSCRCMHTFAYLDCYISLVYLVCST